MPKAQTDHFHTLYADGEEGGEALAPFVKLLGQPRIDVLDGQSHLPSTKPASLLMYLAATRTWVSRERLAYMFRADSPEPIARHYVRNLLYRAQAIPHVQSLEIEATRCQWLVDTDLARFESAIQAESWDEALEWYGGHFLEGADLASTPALEAWADSRREGLLKSWRHASLRSAQSYEAKGAFSSAEDLMKALLDHDPFDEIAFHRYLRNIYRTGRRSDAIAKAQEFVNRLETELELPPLPDTQDLIETISQGHALADVQPPLQRSRFDAVVSGDREFDELVALLTDPKTRLNTILESNHFDNEAVIITRRVSRAGLAHHAIVELIDDLIDEGYAKRALELMVLVLSQAASDDKRLRRRVFAALNRLAPLLPEELVEEARQRW